jgi:hypothetical protein
MQSLWAEIYIIRGIDSPRKLAVLHLLLESRWYNEPIHTSRECRCSGDSCMTTSTDNPINQPNISHSSPSLSLYKLQPPIMTSQSTSAAPQTAYSFPNGHLGHLTPQQSETFNQFKSLCTERNAYNPSTSSGLPSTNDATLLYVLLLNPPISIPV